MNEKPLVQEMSDGSQSAHHKYMDMFVGSRSYWSLLKYELLGVWLAHVPGAAGFALRGKCYPRLFAASGPGSMFGAGITLRCPQRIRLGEGVIVDDHVVLDAKGDGSKIEIGDQVLLGRNTILSCNAAELEIGDFVSIGPFCFFAARSVLTIGSNVAIGAGTHLLGGGHESSDPDTAVIHQERTSEGITIGDNAWIGIGAKILDGVNVGSNSIVGAGAVVSKDVPPYAVVMGNPARVVEKRKKVEAT